MTMWHTDGGKPSVIVFVLFTGARLCVSVDVPRSVDGIPGHPYLPGCRRGLYLLVGSPIRRPGRLPCLGGPWVLRPRLATGLPFRVTVLHHT